MKYFYKTKMTCSKSIEFDINDNIITSVKFEGGCNGNLKAIGKLVEGMDADKIIGILKGNTCGIKPTSCADQLAKAIEEAMNQ